MKKVTRRSEPMVLIDCNDFVKKLKEVGIHNYSQLYHHGNVRSETSKKLFEVKTMKIRPSTLRKVVKVIDEYDGVSSGQMTYEEFKKYEKQKY